jgi:hypothetical protein
VKLRRWSVDVHKHGRSTRAQNGDERGDKPRAIANRQNDAVTPSKANFLTRKPCGESVAGSPQPGTVKSQSSIQIVKRPGITLEQVEQRSRGEILGFSWGI